MVDETETDRDWAKDVETKTLSRVSLTSGIGCRVYGLGCMVDYPNCSSDKTYYKPNAEKSALLIITFSMIMTV